MVLATEITIGPMSYILLIAIFVIAFLYYRIKKINSDPTKTKITSIKGKLIRKVIDNDEDYRNIRNLRRHSFGMAKHTEGSFTKYYITFETEKGIKSFTVSKEIYKNVKMGQKGIIRMRRKKFISFYKK